MTLAQVAEVDVIPWTNTTTGPAPAERYETRCPCRTISRISSGSGAAAPFLPGLPVGRDIDRGARIEERERGSRRVLRPTSCDESSLGSGAVALAGRPSWHGSRRRGDPPCPR